MLERLPVMAWVDRLHFFLLWFAMMVGTRIKRVPRPRVRTRLRRMVQRTLEPC